PGGLSGTALTSVVFPDKMPVINQSMLNGCEKLKEVKLPENLKTIEDFAFLGCSSLESIVIPEKTEKIGLFAFDSCGLKTVTILSDNVDIDDQAFYLCDPSMVIRAAKGSTAEKYAAEHGFKFESAGASVTEAAKAQAPVQETNEAAPADNAGVIRPGDADGSGVVDISDISVLSLALVDGRELTDLQKKALDVDGDADVDLADLARLRQYLSKKIEKL
ncbi:MAG: leucine-rich repeat protein, partial [Oscillospiraceae bacterium]|nr:leucine-rich repeat protein [Oscillospiraceae bacterium]